jgi:hypothetical protein
MRLLHIDTEGRYRLSQDFREDEVPDYTILSHTWGPDEDELTFEDLSTGLDREKPGYQKIVFCGQQAAKHGLEYFCVDTCRIKKSDSSELSRSVISMYQWYKRAKKRYVYLADVPDVGFQNSRWHTRCWTLQEQLAPADVEFFSREWVRLGDKKSLENRYMLSPLAILRQEAFLVDRET